MKLTAAVAQYATVMFDTAATVAKAQTLMVEAAAQGAQVLVFPEAFLGGYPKGADFHIFIGGRTPEGREDFKKYFDAAVTLDGPELAQLAQTAAECKLTVCIGIIERDGGTLYCTAVYLGADAKGQGCVLGHHRKLMPTALERLVWGYGDGSTLKAIDTPYGKLGAVICWENLGLFPLQTGDALSFFVDGCAKDGAAGSPRYLHAVRQSRRRKKCQPQGKAPGRAHCSVEVLLCSGATRRSPRLALHPGLEPSHSRLQGKQAPMPTMRMAMYQQRVALYCAPTADDRDSWIASMQHIAMEGRCFVLSSCQHLRRTDFPMGAMHNRLPAADDTLLMRGGSCIVSPLGKILAGPVYGEDVLLTAEIDTDEIARAQMDFDPVGHYARPDVFQLAVNTAPQRAVHLAPGASTQAASEHARP